MDAVIRSGRAVSETAAAFAVSWWMVRAALTEACVMTLPDVDELSPRMLGIDEHLFRSVRYFQDPESKTWTRYEPWMTTIVDLDTGQVLGVVDGRDHRGVGDWLFARPLAWRLGVQVVAIDPPQRSGKRCGCGFPAPPSRSIISTWSPWPTRP
ncbi:transposase [Arthrobacter sp. Hiyo8]|nr:transposase [Arthrobacter sp. Hiyo8]